MESPTATEAHDQDVQRNQARDDNVLFKFQQGHFQNADKEAFLRQQALEKNGKLSQKLDATVSNERPQNQGRHKKPALSRSEYRRTEQQIAQKLTALQSQFYLDNSTNKENLNQLNSFLTQQIDGEALVDAPEIEQDKLQRLKQLYERYDDMYSSQKNLKSLIQEQPDLYNKLQGALAGNTQGQGDYFFEAKKKKKKEDGTYELKSQVMVVRPSGIPLNILAVFLDKKIEQVVALTYEELLKKYEEQVVKQMEEQDQDELNSSQKINMKVEQNQVLPLDIAIEITKKLGGNVSRSNPHKRSDKPQTVSKSSEPKLTKLLDFGQGVRYIVPESGVHYLYLEKIFAQKVRKEDLLKTLFVNYGYYVKNSPNIKRDDVYKLARQYDVDVIDVDLVAEQQKRQQLLDQQKQSLENQQQHRSKQLNNNTNSNNDKNVSNSSNIQVSSDKSNSPSEEGNLGKSAMDINSQNTQSQQQDFSQQGIDSQNVSVEQSDLDGKNQLDWYRSAFRSDANARSDYDYKIKVERSDGEWYVRSEKVPKEDLKIKKLAQKKESLGPRLRRPGTSTKAELKRAKSEKQRQEAAQRESEMATYVSTEPTRFDRLSYEQRESINGADPINAYKDTQQDLDSELKQFDQRFEGQRQTINQAKPTQALKIFQVAPNNEDIIVQADSIMNEFINQLEYRSTKAPSLKEFPNQDPDDLIVLGDKAMNKFIGQLNFLGAVLQNEQTSDPEAQTNKQVKDGSQNDNSFMSDTIDSANFIFEPQVQDPVVTHKSSSQEILNNDQANNQNSEIDLKLVEDNQPRYNQTDNIEQLGSNVDYSQQHNTASQLSDQNTITISSGVDSLPYDYSKEAFQRKAEKGNPLNRLRAKHKAQFSKENMAQQRDNSQLQQSPEPAQQTTDTDKQYSTLKDNVSQNGSLKSTDEEIQQARNEPYNKVLQDQQMTNSNYQTQQPTQSPPKQEQNKQDFTELTYAFAGSPGSGTRSSPRYSTLDSSQSRSQKVGFHTLGQQKEAQNELNKEQTPNTSQEPLEYTFSFENSIFDKSEMERPSQVEQNKEADPKVQEQQKLDISQSQEQHPNNMQRASSYQSNNNGGLKERRTQSTDPMNEILNKAFRKVYGVNNTSKNGAKKQEDALQSEPKVQNRQVLKSHQQLYKEYRKGLQSAAQPFQGISKAASRSVDNSKFDLQQESLNTKNVGKGNESQLEDFRSKYNAS